MKHQVIPFARQINPGIDRNDPQAAVTAIELRFPGTFSHKAWRVIRYMEGAMFLYAYKGKFIVWMSWKAGWSKLRTNTTSWLRFPDGRQNSLPSVFYAKRPGMSFPPTYW